MPEHHEYHVLPLTGEGTCTFINGDVYTGGFAHGAFEGIGELICVPPVGAITVTTGGKKLKAKGHRSVSKATERRSRMLQNVRQLCNPIEYSMKLEAS